MASNKTKPGSMDFDELLERVKNTRRRGEARRLRKRCVRRATPPAACGASIVVFGVHRYPLTDGKTGKICKIGFAP